VRLGSSGPSDGGAAGRDASPSGTAGKAAAGSSGNDASVSDGADGSAGTGAAGTGAAGTGAAGTGAAGTGAAGATCLPSPSALQVRWRAESNTKDDTDNYNGTEHGGVGYGPGKHGKAFIFDGVNDSIYADPGETLNPPGSFSLEVWVATRATPTVNLAILTRYACGGAVCDNYTYWDIAMLTDGSPRFDSRPPTAAAASSIVASLNKVNDGAFHHIVGVRDVKTAQLLLYVDGVLATSKAISGAELDPFAAGTEADPIILGASPASTFAPESNYFSGAVDDAAIYFKALSASEVAALYAAPNGICPQ
jgi:hypothetical protein